MQLIQTLVNEKTAPIDLKKLSYVVDNEVVKNTEFNTLKTKVNNLEEKIPDATTFILINQYKIWRKKIRDVDKKMPDESGLVITTVLSTKINEVENNTRYQQFSDNNCF